MTAPEFKVVFPVPPPTTNALTPQQRTQLVRKTRKIEQLLGTAPRVIDASIQSPGPIHISFPYGLSQQRSTKGRRSSVDSTSSGSSSGSLPSIQRSYSLSTSIVHPINSKTGSNRHSSPIHPSGELFQSLNYDNAAPLLRLAMESMTLETIPASPSPTRDSFSDPSPQLRLANSDEELPTGVFALTAHERSSPRTSLVVKTKVPSLNSLRKQKMDRLRKKLGSDVPFDLVFPNSKDNESHIPAARSENIPPSRCFREKESLPTPRVPKKHAGRITTSRDSISDATLIHRARRQAHGTAAAKDSLKHRKSRSEPPSLPPLPSLKPKLSCIVESPDEHGSSGCSEEFGRLARVPSKDLESDLMLGWTIKSHEAEFCFWNTRSGYQGWDKSPLASQTLSPVSVHSLSSPDGSTSTCSSSAVESPIMSVSSISTDTSPSPSPTSATVSSEVKAVTKRSPSYRKPPPPIPVDCC